MAGLHKEIQDLKAMQSGVRAWSSRGTCSDTCYMYVRLASLDDVPIWKCYLATILKCQILQYSCVRTSSKPSFKVKILKSAFHDVLVAGKAAGCFIDLWRRVDVRIVRRRGSENGVETKLKVYGSGGSCLASNPGLPHPDFISQTAAR